MQWKVASDGTVHEARIFETLNVSWENVSNVESQPLD